MSRRVLLLVLVMALPAALQAGENPRFTYGSGLIGFLETTVPPQTTCIGGAPTGGSPLCTPETRRIRTRHEVQVWEPASMSGPVAPLLNGPLTFKVNCNFNAAYRGPCWGTFTWDVPGVGSWDGLWIAPVMDLVTYESEFSMVGFGNGGSIDGKKLKVDGFSNPGDWYITITVRVAE